MLNTWPFCDFHKTVSSSRQKHGPERFLASFLPFFCSSGQNAQAREFGALFKMLGNSTEESKLTPDANCGRLAIRRNPDYDAHKDAFLVNIQGPSLATGDLNALGIGVVPGQSRSFIMMMGSALAFLTLGTLLNKKRQPVVPDQELPRLACWSPGENIQITWNVWHSLY